VREGEGKEGVREQESARVLDYSQGTKLGQNKWDKGGTNKKQNAQSLGKIKGIRMNKQKQKKMHKT